MGEGSDDDRRRFPRRVPARSVSVEAETESLDRIEGEARDVSTGGACVALGAELAVGDDVILRLHFLEPERSVLATGRVVWMTTRLWGRPRYGVQWTFPAPKRYWVDFLSRS